MGGQITWAQIFSEMQVNNPHLLWCAKCGVWDGWGPVLWVATFFLSIGLVVALLLPPRRSFRELVQQPHNWAWFFSIIACACWWILWLHARNPLEVLKVVKSDAVSEWQLSPDEVTSLLYYLRTLARTQILLALASLIWIPIPIIMWFRRQKESGEVAAQPPESSHGFQLRFLRSDEPHIGKLSFEGKDWKAGDDCTIEKENLYIELESRGEVIQVTSEPPREADKKWVHLVHDPKDKTLKGHRLEEQPERNGEPCFGPDSEQPSSTVKAGECFWVGRHLHFEFLDPLSVAGLVLATTLVFLTLLSSLKGQVLASPSSGPSLQTGTLCFELDSETPDAQLSFMPGDSATPPGWFVKGKLRITNKLVQVKSLHLNLSSISDSGTAVVVPIPLTKPPSLLPPLYVQFLFDLDRDVIYDPQDNPLLPEVSGGVRDEENFWHEVIARSVSAFHFNGIPNQSDLGAVFCTWKCGNIDPGHPIYAQDDENGHRAESFTGEGMYNRMSYVVQQCLYQNEGQEENEDISKKVYQAQIPQEFKDVGVEEKIPRLLVIIRWRSKPLQGDSYEIFETETKPNTIFVIEIGRSPLPSAQITSQKTIFVPAPTSGRGFEEPDLQPLQEMVETAKGTRDRLGFTARLPYLLDAETANAAYLKVTTGWCESPPIHLAWRNASTTSTLPPSTSPLRTPLQIRLSIGLSVVTLMVQGILIISIIKVR